MFRASSKLFMITRGDWNFYQTGWNCTIKFSDCQHIYVNQEMLTQYFHLIIILKSCNFTKYEETNNLFQTMPITFHATKYSTYPNKFHMKFVSGLKQGIIIINTQITGDKFNLKIQQYKNIRVYIHLKLRQNFHQYHLQESV